MGHTTGGKCLDCGEIFTIYNGGGMNFDLLRCDKCGNTKLMRFIYIDNYFLLSGQLDPYRALNIQPDISLKFISRNDYIEAVGGNCICGGEYTLNAHPRCPKCHSKRLGDVELFLTTHYD